MTRQRGRPFQPGQSGNPKGRPKGRGLKAAIRQALEETTVDGKPPPAEKIADLIVRKALRSPEFALKVADYDLWRNTIPLQVFEDFESTHEEERDVVPEHESERRV